MKYNTKRLLICTGITLLFSAGVIIALFQFSASFRAQWHSVKRDIENTTKATKEYVVETFEPEVEPVFDVPELLYKTDEQIVAMLGEPISTYEAPEHRMFDYYYEKDDVQLSTTFQYSSTNQTARVIRVGITAPNGDWSSKQVLAAGSMEGSKGEKHEVWRWSPSPRYKSPYSALTAYIEPRWEYFFDCNDGHCTRIESRI